MRQSTHHHRHATHESKSVKFWKSFLAFLLFLSLSVTSLSVCARLVMVSPQSLIKLFTNEAYVAALQQDVKEYAFDVCDASTLPHECVEDAISFGTIYQIEKAYIAGSLDADEEFTATTYQDYIAKLGETLQETTAAVMEKQGLVAEESVTDGLDRFAQRITDYVAERVEFPLMSQLQVAVNVGKIGTTVSSIVFAVLSLLLTLIILTFKTKKYRSLREIVYALLAASLLDLSLVAGVALVGAFKDLVLYPAYLTQAVMAYIGGCVLSVGMAAAVLFVIALILMTVIWKVKRDNNV